MKEVNKLIAKAQALINNSEYRSVKLLGVTCSRSDLEMVVFYGETYRRNGGNINGLMKPRGAVGDVFEKTKIVL